MMHFSDLSSTNDITGSHNVVAYKYINDCAPPPDAPMPNVYVLDPYNSDTASEIGFIRTAYEAQNASKCDSVA